MTDDPRDLLERLKEQAQWDSDGFGPLCREAAEAIERLRSDEDIAVRAGRLLRAAAEDARLTLSHQTDNKPMIRAQVRTNLDNAIQAAERAGIERAATIEGDPPRR